MSFWVYNLGLDNDSLQIYWEGALSLDMTQVGTELENWIEVTHSMTATQNGSQLMIKGYDANASAGIDYIDVTAVPEPGTMACVAAGLLALALRRRLGSVR